MTSLPVDLPPMPAAAAGAQKSSAGRALHRRHPQRLAIYPRGARAQGHAGACGTFFLFASLLLGAAAADRARTQLGRGAHVYGVLFGCIGAGAVAGALVPAPRSAAASRPTGLCSAAVSSPPPRPAALAVTQSLALAVPIMLIIGAALACGDVEPDGGGAGGAAGPGSRRAVWR